MPYLSVSDLFKDFSLAYSNKMAWTLPSAPVTLSPIYVDPDSPEALDSPALTRIFQDQRVNEHIENASGTEFGEYLHLAQEMHVIPGHTVRFAVRAANGGAIGVVNCADLDEEIETLNPGLYTSVLGAETRFTGEIAAYHARSSPLAPNGLLAVTTGPCNRLAEAQKQEWLDMLSDPDFRARCRPFAAVIDKTLATVESISTGKSEAAGGWPVLCSEFAYGALIMIKALEKVVSGYGVTAPEIKFIEFVDTENPNPQSLRMVLPFGPKIEGFAWYPNPDGSRRSRIVLSQRIAEIDAFLAYAREQ